MLNKTVDWHLLVVIINYRTPKLVCDALSSLERELDHTEAHVVVVDNNSGDNSCEFINQHISKENYKSWVTLVSAELNGGFSYGNNIGMKFANADYYLFLNSDAYVLPGAIINLLEAMESDNKVGIVGPKLEWPDGSQQVSCFKNLTPQNGFLSAVKTGIFTKLFTLFGIKEVAISLDQHQIERPEWLSFACVMLRGQMVKEIGLMDEGYFMYREDNDYCRRATEAGWGLVFAPKSKVVHLNKGASNQMGLKRLPRYYFQSRSRYFIKYYGRLGLFMANLYWSLGRCISLLRELIQRKPKEFHSTMLFDIWVGFLTQVRKNEE